MRLSIKIANTSCGRVLVRIPLRCGCCWDERVIDPMDALLLGQHLRVAAGIAAVIIGTAMPEAFVLAEGEA